MDNKKIIIGLVGGAIIYYLYKKSIQKTTATETAPVVTKEEIKKTETDDGSIRRSTKGKTVADLFIKVQKSLGEQTGGDESEKLIYMYFDSLKDEDLKDWTTMLNSDAWADYSRVNNSFDATRQEKALARRRFAKAMESFKIDVTRFEGLLKSMSLFIQKIVLESMKEAGFNTENVEITPYEEKNSFNGQISEVNGLVDLN